MRINNGVLMILVAASLITACVNKQEKGPITISGKIDASAVSGSASGPTLVAVAKTDSIEAIERDPAGAIVMIAGIDEHSGTYELELGEYDVQPGDPVTIIAFIDNAYANGIPYPKRGDFIGFYIEPSSLSTSYALKAGANPNLDIAINREVFSFDAAVLGTIGGTEAGDVIVIAYAGEITSSDMSALDTSAVIGYARASKGAAPTPYRVRIMPYGYNVPIQNVYLIAVLDRNRNGVVDGGDAIGFHAAGANGLPTPITVNEGENAGIDIAFSMTVPVPSGVAMSIKGSFAVPAGYNASSKPMYLIVARIDNPETLFTDPLAAIKYFYKMPPGEFVFNIDLSKTDLVPGDRVVVATLWDRDNAGGFPYPTRGDKLGLAQNNDTYSYFIELALGVNPVPQEGYEFNTNKLMYDFDSSVKFALDRGAIESYNVDTAQIIILCVHVNGVDIGIKPSGVSVKIDMDYVLGSTVIRPPAFDHITSAPHPILPAEDMRTLGIFRALYQEIVVWENSVPPDPLIQGVANPSSGETETAYLFAVLDRNGNGNLDSDDVVGYYNREYVVTTGSIVIPGYGSVAVPNGTYYLPATIRTISTGANTNSDGQPYWITFRYYDPP